MLNYSIESLRMTFTRFDTNFNVKVCVRVMISWVVLYANRKYDPYMVVRVQTVLVSNT